MPDCLICREINSEIPIPGGFIVNDPLIVAFHMPPLEQNPRPYLGHLLVVSRRHAPRFGDRTDEEGAAVGRTAVQLERALTDLGGAEWVYSAVIGLQVPHFHLHLLPRYPGTPREARWYVIDEWQGGRHSGPAANRRACRPAEGFDRTLYYIWQLSVIQWSREKRSP